jgi:hypothetical protein
MPLIDTDGPGAKLGDQERPTKHGKILEKHYLLDENGMGIA